jgi:hypothetical protein
VWHRRGQVLNQVADDFPVLARRAEYPGFPRDVRRGSLGAVDFKAKVESGLAWWRDLPGDRALRAALFVWALYMLIIVVVVAARPDKRTVTPEYREAAVEWWSGQPIYEVREGGFLYLPQAAILYTPYALLPKRVGEPLWRLTGLGLFAWSIWRLCSVFGGDRRRWWFLLATVAALPASFSSARNGQANLPMAALLAFAAVDLGRAAWNAGTLSLLLSFALKPLGAVPCLLAGACFPRSMIWRLGIGLVLLLAAAFVGSDPAYAAEQYRLFVETMQVARLPVRHVYADVMGILKTVGLDPGAADMTGVRAVAALGTLGLAWLAVRRYERARGAFVVLALSALYLLVFNPRTEANTYVLMAPFAGLLVAAAAESPGRAVRFLWLAAFALALSSENWGPLHKLTNPWFKPLVSLVLLGFLAADLIRCRPPLGLAAPAGDASKP